MDEALALAARCGVARRGAGGRARRARRRGDRPRRQRADLAQRSHRARRDRRAARRGARARQLSARRLRPLRDARAVRDVRRRDLPCAHRARRVRRARSQVRRVRLGGRSLRRGRLNHHATAIGGVRAEECGAAAVRVLRRAPQKRREAAARCRPVRAVGLRARSRRRSTARRRASIAMWERVVVDPTCRTRWQRFAASDDERLAAVLAHGARSARRSRDRAARRLRLDAPLAAPRLRARSPQAGKQWLGYSDFTAFQLAALAQCRDGHVRRTGRSSDFGAAEPVGVHARPLLRVARPVDATRWPARSTGRTSCCAGTLWGGNLAMVAHLCGTPHFPVRRRRHPLPGGRRRDAVPDRAHALPAASRGRARAAARDPARPASPSTRCRANDGGYDLDAAVAHLREVCADARLHRPAVRPRSRQAHAAGRRPLRAHGARRRARRWCSPTMSR